MTENTGYPKILNAFLLLLLLIVLLVVSGFIIGILEIFLKPKGHDTLIMGIGNLIAFFIVILIGLKKAKISFSAIFEPVKANGVIYISIFVACFGLSILFSEIDNGFRTVFPPPKYIDDLFQGLFKNSNIFESLFTLSLVAPFTEELLFRRIIFAGFAKNYRVVTAAVVSALFFGIMHLNPWQLTTAFLVGLYFALLYYKTGSVIPSILGHAIFNGTPVFFVSVFKIEIPGYSASPVNGQFQPLWFDALGLFLFGLGLFLFFASLKKEDENIIEENTPAV